MDNREPNFAAVRFQPAGRVVLPSGRLIAAEPLANGVPFDRTVAPGEYPVEVAVDEYGTVIAARVVIRDEPASAWGIARIGGQELAYPVDGGSGCFGSPEIFAALAADDEMRDDLIADVSFDNDADAATFTDDTTGNTLVTFRSGDGDGAYVTWLGETALGEPVCFVTDFGVVLY